MGLTAEQKALYMAMGLAGELVRRDPGQIGGQQFIVDGVEDCVVEVLDHTAQVTVDDAKRCTITIGAQHRARRARRCTPSVCGLSDGWVCGGGRAVRGLAVRARL